MHGIVDLLNLLGIQVYALAILKFSLALEVQYQYFGALILENEQSMQILEALLTDFHCYERKVFLAALLGVRRQRFLGARNEALAPRQMTKKAVVSDASTDQGRSWPERRNLEVGDGYCLSNNSREGLNREFSYPSIHEGQDGALHLAYTYFRQAIKYVRIDPSWVSATEAGDDD